MKQTIHTLSRQLAGLYSEPEARQLAGRLLCRVLHLQAYELLSCKDKQLSVTEKHELEAMTARLLRHEPLQYVLGETEFYGLNFKVTPETLIPRPETEELVEWILQCAGEKAIGRLLDIGTGSGCIAIALAKYLPGARVYGLDVSEEALNVARGNARDNSVQVDWLHADILQNLAGDFPGGLDLIVSNPPYVTLREKAIMQENVLGYEPHRALFVPDDRALLFYERIADIGREKLSPGGCLFFEINALYGKETVGMLAGKQYRNIELRRDISGKDRMIKAVL